MSARMVQIGARIPQHDAEFISGLRIDGASTPSDKLRAIVAEARRRHEGGQDYDSALELAREQMAPAIRRLKRMEFESGAHSELLGRLLEWLPEMVAFATSGLPPARDGATAGVPGAFEAGAADRVFRLIEIVLQLAVTRRAQCYDEALFEQRIPPILELARIIDPARNADPKER